jgi:hypothetical protein
MSSKQELKFCTNCNEILPANKRVPNHPLHIVLSILTVGFWIIIWLLMIFDGMTRRFRCVKCGNATADFKKKSSILNNPILQHKDTEEVYWSLLGGILIVVSFLLCFSMLSNTYTLFEYFIISLTLILSLILFPLSSSLLRNKIGFSLTNEQKTNLIVLYGVLLCIVYLR